MGSFLVLGRQEIAIVLTAVLATDYLAVWALRTRSDDDLNGISID